MPGGTPSAAIDAFLLPLRQAIACLGRAHLTLSQGARGKTGETCSWTLNDGDGMPLSAPAPRRFTAVMQFECLDRGESRRGERYRISTRGYMYGLENRAGSEIIAAHWHPLGSSPYREPHYHVGSAALTDDGVFSPRAHIPSHRVSLEGMIRMLITQFDIVATCGDWDQRLRQTEETFNRYKSWGDD